MRFDRVVNFRTFTNGTSLWSNVKRSVAINRIVLAYESDDGKFGELRAYFKPSEWDSEDGLIYTDEGWLASFKNCMRTLGFSNTAVDAISYSEALMQGETFVSLDVFDAFMLECSPLYRFTVNKESPNLQGE